jgi:hypothetical protein
MIMTSDNSNNVTDFNNSNELLKTSFAKWKWLLDSIKTDIKNFTDFNNYDNNTKFSEIEY